jgi:pyruvate kinase
MSSISVPTLSSPSIGQLVAQQQTTTLAHMCCLDIDSQPVEYRKTSIVCTIGPKTNKVAVLQDMIRAGMCIVRMNFSHGSYEVSRQLQSNTTAKSMSSSNSHQPQ